MRWLQSGLRRDICTVVAGLDDPTGQQVKAALERHYDDRIRPKTFHGALEALVDGGFLARRQDGLADRYALTEAGERRLRTHHEWVAANLGADDGGDVDETDATDERAGDDVDSTADATADTDGDDASERAGASHGGDGKENR